MTCASRAATRLTNGRSQEPQASALPVAPFRHGQSAGIRQKTRFGRTAVQSRGDGWAAVRPLALPFDAQWTPKRTLAGSGGQPETPLDGARWACDRLSVVVAHSLGGSKYLQSRRVAEALLVSSAEAVHLICFLEKSWHGGHDWPRLAMLRRMKIAYRSRGDVDHAICNSKRCNMGAAEGGVQVRMAAGNRSRSSGWSQQVLKRMPSCFHPRVTAVQ